MTKWLKAVGIGMMIVTALDQIQEFQDWKPAQLDVEWKGVIYRVTLKRTKVGS